MNELTKRIEELEKEVILLRKSRESTKEEVIKEIHDMFELNFYKKDSVFGEDKIGNLDRLNLDSLVNLLRLVQGLKNKGHTKKVRKFGMINKRIPLRRKK